jgi:ankyrin repeat protein
MLKNVFNPNLRDKAGRTPVHIAVDLIRQGNSVASYQMARLGRDDILPRLLEARADTNVRDSNGVTPLDQAIKYSNDGLVELLVNAGAMPTKKTLKPSNKGLARKLKRLEKASAARDSTPLENKSAPSKLAGFCNAHSADLRALFRLFEEGAESSLTGQDGGGWSIQVVSAEGNFATVKARIAGINFYLSCQIKPLSVTNEFGMTVFHDEM